MPPTRPIVYPCSDGVPLGDGSLAVQRIFSLYLGFQCLYRHRTDVFVASNLIWYPVEGKPRVRAAPDILVALGRPPGDRLTYLQWEEGGVAPQVVMEILGPTYTPAVRARLAAFCERHGVEEFYEYDPEAREFTAHLRTGKRFGPPTPVAGHTSARLGVRFEVPADGELRVIGPDGAPFRSYLELADDALANQERLVEERQKRIEAERKADRLRAQLRALGIDPDAV